MDKKRDKTHTWNRIWGLTTQSRPQRTWRVETYPGRHRCGSSTDKICMETALFRRLFFHDSTSQDKRLLLMLPFQESQWRHMRVVYGVFLSVFLRWLVRECSDLRPFVLILYLLINNFSHVWTNFCLQPIL